MNNSVTPIYISGSAVMHATYDILLLHFIHYTLFVSIKRWPKSFILRSSSTCSHCHSFHLQLFSAALQQLFLVRIFLFYDYIERIHVSSPSFSIRHENLALLSRNVHLHLPKAMRNIASQKTLCIVSILCKSFSWRTGKWHFYAFGSLVISNPNVFYVHEKMSKIWSRK